MDRDIWSPSVHFVVVWHTNRTIRGLRGISSDCNSRRSRTFRATCVGTPYCCCTASLELWVHWMPKQSTFPQTPSSARPTSPSVSPGGSCQHRDEERTLVIAALQQSATREDKRRARQLETRKQPSKLDGKATECSSRPEFCSEHVHPRKFSFICPCLQTKGQGHPQRDRGDTMSRIENGFLFAQRKAMKWTRHSISNRILCPLGTLLCDTFRPGFTIQKHVYFDKWKVCWPRSEPSIHNSICCL